MAKLCSAPRGNQWCGGLGQVGAEVEKVEGFIGKGRG